MPPFPSNWVYEPFPGYQEPEIAPLPPLDDPEELRQMRIRPTSVGKTILRGFWKLSGFWRFYKNLQPENLEYMLRTTNLRTPGLFAPVISATVLLHPSQHKTIDWLDRATALILAAWQVKNDVFNGKIAQDFWKNKPLEMGQYANLFGSILDVGQRPINLWKNPHASDILVLVHGNFFVIPFVQDFAELRRYLAECVTAGRKKMEMVARSPGWLTAANNRVQLAYWSRLLKNASNRNTFEKIKQTFITICLDDAITVSDEQTAARWIHIGNPGNRFYLVGTQLVVLQSGEAGAIMNFTANIDGNPMSRFADEIYRRSEALLSELPTTSASIEKSTPPEILHWQIPDTVLHKAQKQIQSIIDLQPHTFVLKGLGKKAWGPVRKDAIPWFVMALMYTGYQLTGSVPVVEQFVSLAHFRCMGLTRQVVTGPECHHAFQLMEKNPDSKECWQALLKCIEQQKIRIRQARRFLPLSTLEGLYVRRISKGKQRWFFLLFHLRRLLLRFTGNRLSLPTDLLISHPRIFPSYTIIGRPGVRLPYVRQFGLHYQIHEDKTVLIFMPGKQWRIPNAVVARRLEQNLRLFIQMVTLHYQNALSQNEPIPSSSFPQNIKH